MRNYIFCLILISLSLGCVGVSGVAIGKKIIGNYYLIATDIDEDCGLSYHEPSDGPNYGGLIEATVFGVGTLNI
jgi:hypothetical protein